MGAVSTTVLLGLLTCVIIGAIYLRVWFASRDRLDYFYFSLTAFTIAGYAGAELRMMHALTGDAYLSALNFGHFFAWTSYITFLLFLWHYLRSGRAWLFWTAVILRSLAFIIHLMSPAGINFTEVTGVKQVVFFGESLSIAVGTRNPLMVIGHAGTVLILFYCIDASITVWRRGERGLASWVGATAILFIGGRLLDSMLVMWGFVQFPLTVSPFFFGLVIAMGYKLSLDVIRSTELSAELERRHAESEQLQNALNVAEAAGNVGVWVRHLDDGTLWASPEWHQMFGFDADEPISFEKYLEKIHPDDQSLVKDKLDTLLAGSGNYSSEYRVVRPDGTIRWIKSRGRLETKNGKPKTVFGASADITDEKQAESRIHDLGGRLIGAQEAERARLGRELHDDLTQRLALLSIQLGMLSDKGSPDLEKRIHQLSESVDVISADVHRISHELHPANLEQLGLETALSGFCREVSEARGIRVDFHCGRFPRRVSKDISLCLFRIGQEALNNITKHSNATIAEVTLQLDGKIVKLEVSDNGKGFNARNGKSKNSLGLISMQERLATVNGTLDIDSKIGTGTRITASIPLKTGKNGNHKSASNGSGTDHNSAAG